MSKLGKPQDRFALRFEHFGHTRLPFQALSKYCLQRRHIRLPFPLNTILTYYLPVIGV